jgi:hypothetical protein
MEIRYLVVLLLGMIVFCAIYLSSNAVLVRRRDRLTSFCSRGDSPDCDSVINEVDYRGLEINRFVLCSYFCKIIDREKLEQVDALYWSLQSIRHSRKKELCRQTFKQAITATDNPILATMVMAGLMRQASGLQLVVVDSILSILAETPISHRDEFFIKMTGKFEEFLLAEPGRTGFVAVMKFKIKKDLCL